MTSNLKESRFSNLAYIVEANSFEKRNLWNQYRFKHESSFELVKVGEMGKRPIIISCSWAFLNDKKIMFVHPTSTLVDYEMIQLWIKNNCKSDNIYSNLSLIDTKTFVGHLGRVEI